MFGNILPIFNCGNFPLPNCSTVFTRRKAVADAGRDAGCGNVIFFFFRGKRKLWNVVFVFVPKKLSRTFRMLTFFITPEDKHVPIIPWSFGSDHFSFYSWVFRRFQSLIFRSVYLPLLGRCATPTFSSPGHRSRWTRRNCWTQNPEPRRWGAAIFFFSFVAVQRWRTWRLFFFSEGFIVCICTYIHIYICTTCVCTWYMIV